MNSIIWYLLMILAGMLLSIPCFFLDLKGFKKGHRIVFCILVLVSIIEFYGGYLGKQGIRNHWVYNIGFVYGETILILIYLSAVLNGQKSKVILKLTALLFGVFGILNSLFLNPIDQFHNFSLTIGSTLIILGCFYFFYVVMTQDTYLDEKLWQVPDFWVVSFFLLFYSASMLFFTFLYNIMELEAAMWMRLNFVLKLIGGTMYLVFGLVYYLPVFSKKLTS
ncbi:hypothetical protein [Cognataquiflexum rubidum]|uniref:hypothetical protein n=1 Tax=Cognataquiflexum rubidum TaxID=2922273 RepID=UPI001F129C80|nr:hypothetical protein [Cognataquiflexum rubidum]MCH6235320.1 hypothetical protein [Cognataquiflexum rubidum]